MSNGTWVPPLWFVFSLDFLTLLSLSIGYLGPAIRKSHPKGKWDLAMINKEIVIRHLHAWSSVTLALSFAVLIVVRYVLHGSLWDKSGGDAWRVFLAAVGARFILSTQAPTRRISDLNRLRCVLVAPSLRRYQIKPCPYSEVRGDVDELKLLGSPYMSSVRVEVEASDRLQEERDRNDVIFSPYLPSVRDGVEGSDRLQEEWDGNDETFADDRTRRQRSALAQLVQSASNFIESWWVGQKVTNERSGDNDETFTDRKTPTYPSVLVPCVSNVSGNWWVGWKVTNKRPWEYEPESLFLSNGVAGTVWEGYVVDAPFEITEDQEELMDLPDVSADESWRDPDTLKGVLAQVLGSKFPPGLQAEIWNHEQLTLPKLHGTESLTYTARAAKVSQESLEKLKNKNVPTGNFNYAPLWLWYSKEYSGFFRLRLMRHWIEQAEQNGRNTVKDCIDAQDLGPLLRAMGKNNYNPHNGGRRRTAATNSRPDEMTPLMGTSNIV